MMKDNNPQQTTEQQGTRKAGTIMMGLAWLSAFILLGLFFTEKEEQQYNPNRNPLANSDQQSNTVILQRNRYHHYVSNGTINQKKVTFLLDTGATDVVIPEDTAQRLGLIKGRKIQASTANGIIDIYQTRLSELSIGSITLYDVDASINPYMHDDSILLGMSALKDIEFTQRGDQLSLKQYR